MAFRNGAEAEAVFPKSRRAGSQLTVEVSRAADEARFSENMKRRRLQRCGHGEQT